MCLDGHPTAGTDLEPRLRIHQEVPREVIEHDRVVRTPLRVLAPDASERFHVEEPVLVILRGGGGGCT